MGFLVQESCHVRDAAVVIPRGFTGMLQEGLGMPHVRPEVVVGGELCLMFGRFGAFQGEVVGQVCSSAVKLSSLSLDKTVS